MSSRWHDLSTQELFRELRDSNSPELREHLIERHEGLVRHVANSYRDSGVPYDDLVGVGHIGLVNAVDRYDPERGTKFATFAVPTIRGEMRRYFRDAMWGLRVPRRIQELSLQVREASEHFIQQKGRSATYGELAALLNVSDEAIIEALEVANQYELASIDEAGPEEDAGETGLSLADRTGAADPDLEALGTADEIRWALAQLLPRERVIVKLRYFHELSQQQVAERLGISQMHVSRLQRRALERLREIFKVQEGENST